MSRHKPFDRVTEGSGLSLWMIGCLIIAALKIALAIFCLGSGDASPAANNTLYLLFVLSFGLPGSVLLYHLRKDRRAAYLGCTFILFASSFADSVLKGVPTGSPAFGNAVHFLYTVHVFSFAPCFLWLFVQDFPRGLNTSLMTRILRAGYIVSLSSAIALLGINVLKAFVTMPEFLTFPAGMRLYWLLVYALIIPTFAISVWKLKMAPVTERRRVRLLILGFLIGMVPLTVAAALEILVPRMAVLIQAHRTLEFAILYPLLLSLPITTSYSVLVHRALDIRLIIRKAVQYAFARYSVIGLAALPFAFLGLYVYQNRKQSIETLFRGTQLWALVLITAVALLLVPLRKRILTTIDRKFFREEYVAHNLLSKLVEATLHAASIGDLIELLIQQIDRALHLENTAVLVLDRKSAALVEPSGRCKSLPQSSKLYELIENSSLLLDVDFDEEHFQLLPAADQQWLSIGGFQLMAALLGKSGNMLGVIALGSKKSELPFSSEDKSLIRAIAGSAAVTLENRFIESEIPIRAPAATIDDDVAKVCVACYTVQSAASEQCGACGGETSNALVPAVLWGKFQLEAQVGVGGMGIVYRGMDLTLRRKVAIKTLPKVSPWHAMLLRREARAMAAVVHPNLATIFGAETWNGLPILMVEFMDGGTLADRLQRSPLSLANTLELGVVLAKVLERVHSAGILHRDIKPSNIGFTKEGSAKLMDFGLARMLHQTSKPNDKPSRAVSMADAAAAVTVPEVGTDESIIGTPLYMSPEALNGMPPTPDFDLWGLHVVLFECLTGQKPFKDRADLQKLLRRMPDAPPLGTYIKDAPQSLEDFFRHAFAANLEKRPRNAADLRRSLEELALQMHTLQPQRSKTT